MIRKLFIGMSCSFLFLMLGLPLVIVITEALKEGILTYFEVIRDDMTMKALFLTLGTASLVTLLNTVFGLMAAWTITKFKFKGKNFLITLIDIPFAVSPVIAGLLLVMSFGRGGPLYDLLNSIGIQIIFAVPGIVMATTFVTFPFVAREIIPLMQAQGNVEEEAAAMMGAKGWKIFRRITLPNIRWGLLYGMILCFARAIGEFGAVSVVSGHIRGVTNTLPLHVEILYNEYQFTAAFAVASLLLVIAIVLLIIRNVIEGIGKKEGAIYGYSSQKSV